MGVSLYQMMETGARPIRKMSVRAPRPRLGDLAALARRRLGWNLRLAARKVGVSHASLLHWERTSHPKLIEFYRDKLEFRFN